MINLHRSTCTVPRLSFAQLSRTLPEVACCSIQSFSYSGLRPYRHFHCCNSLEFISVCCHNPFIIAFALLYVHLWLKCYGRGIYDVLTLAYLLLCVFPAILAPFGWSLHWDWKVAKYSCFWFVSKDVNFRLIDRWQVVRNKIYLKESFCFWQFWVFLRVDGLC